MTYVTPKNSQTPSTQDPYNVPYDDFEDDDMEAVEPPEDYFPEEAGPQGPAVPQTANEMRAYLSDMHQAGKLSDEEYQQYLGKVNQAAGFSDAARLQVFSEIYQQFAGQAGSAEGDYYADADAPKVSSQQITELLNELKNGQVQSTDDSMSTEKCIDTLKQALTDERNHNSPRAAAEFRAVLDAVGGEEAIDPKNIAAGQLGATPTSIDKDGTFHFDGHAPEGSSDFNLRSPGDGSKVVVDNATSVTLTPKNSMDEVTIREEGNYYVVEMGGDTFKINKDAKLNIVSDHVSGDVANEDGNVTVGANSSKTKKYFSPEKLQELSGKITAGAQYVGQHTPLKADMDNEKASQILKDMAAAMAESDPEKRKELWKTVSKSLNELGTNSDYTGDNKGYSNDVAQLVFNMLYDNLGEDGLKDALKQGLIPQDIATNLAVRLTAKINENTTDDYTQAGNNGPGWTHQTSADFLTTNSAGTAAPTTPSA